jgi:hypothetical protein
MEDGSVDGFRRAIRKMHGVEAQLVRRERVVQHFEGELVWQGEVLVFTLIEHALAKICYAWETGGRVTAFLGVGSIDSASKAVDAALGAGDG